jgi:hypothetical protein
MEAAAIILDCIITLPPEDPLTAPALEDADVDVERDVVETKKQPRNTLDVDSPAALFGCW